MAVSFNGKHLAKFIRPEEYEAIYPQVELAHNQLESKTGAGNDFLGWLDLPVTYDKEEFARIKEAAQKIRSDSDVLLVAGIGGSYLGARAVVEAVKGLYHNEVDDGLKIYFCGNTISHGPERHHQADEGQALLDQRHLQVRHHHRDRARVPRAAQAA